MQSEVIVEVISSEPPSKILIKRRGLDHMLTSPDAHAQNGRVERAIFTVMNRGRVYLIDSQLPKRFWPHAAKYATYVLNRSSAGPAKLLPKDRWRQRSVELDHLQPFGVDLWFRNHTESDKLSPRYIEGKLLGYVEGTHNYVVVTANG